MNYKLRIANQAEWSQFLELSDVDYSLSQTYEFGEALAEAYGEYSYEPRIFEFDDGTTMLLPLVNVRRRLSFLRFFESMPLSLNGAPIPIGGYLTAEHLQTAIRSLRADSISLNTSGSSSILSDGALIKRLKTSEASTHILDLGRGFDYVWTNRFKGKTRNQCRSAERRGVRVCDGQTADDFETYYAMYTASTVRWGLAAPTYPLALFRSLSKLYDIGVELKIAFVDDRAVAGVLLFHGRRTTLYWGSAMLKEYGNYSPVNALLQSAIYSSCRRGMEWFDFGASGKLDSVRAFKEGFGGKKRTYRNYAGSTLRYRVITGARRAWLSGQ